MKRLFYFALTLTLIITLSACSNNNDKNAMIGTTWRASYVKELFVIEFEDDSRVSGFRADANGNIKGSVYYGTYSFTGNNIVFNDFQIVNFYRFHFTDGIVSGNNMTLNYWWNMGAPGNEQRFDDQMTFHKQ